MIRTWCGLAWPQLIGCRSIAVVMSSRCCSGVDPELRSIILSGGHRLRVYVPYGRDWYPYSMRRLRENPTIAHHVARAMLTR